VKISRNGLGLKIKACDTLAVIDSRDVKRTSNLRTLKFIFRFGILTFDIRVKFVLEQMWALKCLRTRRDVFVLCQRLMPAASPATLLVSDYPSRPRLISLVLPSVSQSAQFDSSHAGILVD